MSKRDRVFIADRLLANWSIRRIARELGRSPSTVSREVRHNGHPKMVRTGRSWCRTVPTLADQGSNPGKLALNSELREYVQGKLDVRWSPEQIARALRREFPDRPEMHVVHETIYLALYVQGRGELRRELHKALRTGRARRKSHRQAQRRQPRFMDPMVMISDRPAEAADRAIPGHWEGDLLIGKNQRSAVATLVERSPRYLMLVHLPHDHSAGAVRKALVENITTLPAQLRRSPTWDQSSEMGQHKAFTIATDMPVYFCDPRHHGSADRTRTPTASYGSTSRKARTSHSTGQTSSPESRTR